MEKFPENIEVTRILLSGNSRSGKIISNTPTYSPPVITGSTGTNPTVPAVQNPPTTGNVVPSVPQMPLPGTIPATPTTTTNTAPSTTISVAPIYSNIKFQLPKPFLDVIHVDWAFISGLASPCFCSISELEQNGITLDGIPYWRYLHTSGTIRNPSSDILPVKLGFPRTFNTLSVLLMDSNGRSINQTDSNWSIELIIFSLPQ